MKGDSTSCHISSVNESANIKGSANVKKKSKTSLLCICDSFQAGEQ